MNVQPLKSKYNLQLLYVNMLVLENLLEQRIFFLSLWPDFFLILSVLNKYEIQCNNYNGYDNK